MADYRKGSHTIHDIKLHFVWATKYRYKILTEQVADRCRELIRQICKRNRVEIIKGHMEPEHIHLFVSVPPTISPSKLMQYIKGSSSRRLQQEFPYLNKRYWGRHMWRTGYFVASAGTVTEQMIKDYLDHHRDEDEDDFTISGEPDNLQ